MHEEKQTWKKMLREQDISAIEEIKEQEEQRLDNLDHQNAPTWIWLQVCVMSDEELARKCEELGISVKSSTRKEMVYNFVDVLCMKLMVDDKAVDAARKVVSYSCASADC